MMESKFLEEVLKYFTPELMGRYGSAGNPIANAADAEWEAQVERYDRHLQRIAADFTPSHRTYSEIPLHDAVVQSMSRHGDRLVIPPTGGLAPPGLSRRGGCRRTGCRHAKGTREGQPSAGASGGYADCPRGSAADRCSQDNPRSRKKKTS
jgi:hypothetical protein